MATTADIKIGMCIELDGKTFQIVDFQHVKPGKGPAFVRTKLKNLENGRVVDNTFTAGAKIEPVRVERRPYQFTYEDDLGAHFMHTETFEEINIDKNLIQNYDLMADGQIVEVMFHTEKETVLSAELPPIVDMEPAPVSTVVGPGRAKRPPLACVDPEKGRPSAGTDGGKALAIGSKGRTGRKTGSVRGCRRDGWRKRSCGRPGTGRER